MGLSNKKLKYIQRHAATESAAQIAKAIQSPLAEVQRELARLKGGGPAAVADLPVGALVASPRELLSLTFAVFACLTPLLIFRDLAEAAKTPQAAYLQAGGLVFALVWLAWRSQREPLHLGPPWLLAIMVALIGWSWLSFLWAESFRDGLERALMWSACPLFYLLVLNLFRQRRAIDRFLVCLWGVTVLCSFIGLCQFYFGSGGFWQEAFGLSPVGANRMADAFGFNWLMQTARPASTFMNKNMAVDFVVITVPLGLYFFLRWPATWRKAIAAAGSVVIYAFVFHSRTKGGWAAMGLQLVVLALYLGWHLARRQPAMRLNWREAGVLGGALAALVLIINLMPSIGFSWQLGPALQTVIGTVERSDIYEQRKEDAPYLQPAGEDDQQSLALVPQSEAPGANSLAVRLVVWRNTLAMWREHLFVGVGIGNFRTHYDRFAQSAVRDPFWPSFEWHRTHNDYLQLLAELGLVGGLLLAALLGGIGWLSLRRLADRKDSLSLVLVLGLLGAMVSAFISFPWDRTLPPLAVTCFVAILVLRAVAEGETADTKPLLLPAWRGGLALALAVALVATVFCQVRIVRGDYWARKMYDHNAGKNYQGVVDAVRNLRRVEPWNDRPLLYEGRALLSMERAQEAVIPLERLCQKLNHWYVALHNLAVTYQRLGNPAVGGKPATPPAADRVYDPLGGGEAIALGPDASNGELAIAYAARAIALFPQAAETYNAMSCAYLGMRQFALSATYARKALEFNPNHQEYWYNLGLATYWQANQLDEQVKPLHILVRTTGLAGDIFGGRVAMVRLGMRGQSLLWQGQVASERVTVTDRAREAIGYLEKAGGLKLDYAMPYKDMGAIYQHKLGDEVRTLRAYARALLRDPNVEMGPQMLATLRINDLLTALAVSDLAREYEQRVAGVAAAHRLANPVGSSAGQADALMATVKQAIAAAIGSRWNGYESGPFPPFPAGNELEPAAQLDLYEFRYRYAIGFASYRYAAYLKTTGGDFMAAAQTARDHLERAAQLKSRNADVCTFLGEVYDQLLADENGAATWYTRAYLALLDNGGKVHPRQEGVVTWIKQHQRTVKPPLPPAVVPTRQPGNRGLVLLGFLYALVLIGCLKLETGVTPGK